MAKQYIFGGILILLGLCQTVLSTQTTHGEDVMLSDDYDYYSDDQSAQNPQVTPRNSNAPKTYFPKPNVTVTGYMGKDITMQCDAKNLKDEVILWYKDNNMISTGKNLVSPMYSLDPNTFALTIINATASSKGHYFCELLPQKIRMQYTIIMAEKPIEPLAPESSEAFQSVAGGGRATSSISLTMLAATYGIILILRL